MRNALALVPKKQQSKRKRYSAEFKREAVKLARRSDTSVQQLTLDIGISPNMLNRWIRESEGDASRAFAGNCTPRDEGLARLKRYLALVAKERDFLRDAAAYFAKGSSPGTR